MGGTNPFSGGAGTRITLSAQHGDHVGMRGPGRVRDQHFIAGIQDGLQGKIISMDAAMRHQNLGLGVVDQVLVTTQLGSGSSPQVRDSRGWGRNGSVRLAWL